MPRTYTLNDKMLERLTASDEFSVLPQEPANYLVEFLQDSFGGMNKVNLNLIQARLDQFLENAGLADQVGLRAKILETLRSQSRRAADREAFWQAAVDHSPELFAKHSVVANGSASQWLTPENVHNLVVSIYIALDGVVVFLRGRRGATPADVLEIFEPKLAEFKAMVEDEMYDASTSTHPGIAFKIDMTDQDNWDEAISWMVHKAQMWLAAASAIFGEMD